MAFWGSFKKKKPQQSQRLLQEEIKPQEQLKKQDEQLKAIKKAEITYEETGDIGALIAFWEGVWSSSGLLFNGSKWTFRLTELYIQTERYDDAIEALGKIKKPEYSERKRSLINKVNELKSRKRG